MVITPSFQVGDVGSIPATRSTEKTANREKTLKPSHQDVKLAGIV